MIKLKALIPEVINLLVLQEQIASSQVDPVLDGEKGKFWHVSFDYTVDGVTSNRWCQLYQRNITTRNNGAISAYQISRNGSTLPIDGKPVVGWRIFRLDRMSNFRVSRVPFYQPKSGFNRTGNRTPSIRQTIKIAPVGTYQYKNPKYQPKIS
jgi:hypothetical protein